MIRIAWFVFRVPCLSLLFLQLLQVMELPTIEQLNLQASPSENEEWVERFKLWCSIRKGGAQNQSAILLTAGSRDLYFVLKNLAFPDAPAKLPYEALKSDVVCFRGNDLRPSNGTMTHKISQAMVGITDLTDMTVHRGNIDQIHFNETPTSIEDHAEETQGSPPCNTPSTTTEDQKQQPPIQGTYTDENTPLTLHRPIRRASQIDEALLREESCCDLGLRDDAYPEAARYSFWTTAINQI
ncbi:unnamed protein product [Echinostoma caproni]|uniref:Uncharacterized protein n=1 Tax=Echinostoma caproni TaxID=27848 RepID=A0A183AV77_9TREM|nr:unnamed protein product [Echinostoma caproni]